jgi:hypothetical protein
MAAPAQPGMPAADMAPPPAPPPPPSSAIATGTAPLGSRLPQSGQLTAGVWDDNRNFDFFSPYAAKTDRRSDYPLFNATQLQAAHRDALQQTSSKSELDVQLLLDTTGSMGDELSYLQSEFDSIAQQVRAKFPNVTPRWSLVLYRDHGDEYLTRAFDFTTDTNRFRENLRAQNANGGGDTPEAVVEGMNKGLSQHWRAEGNVAKVAFWVADAPSHPGEGPKLASAIVDAKKKGVHIYPVASSDADDDAELEMRTAAQMTGGRYVFLTNDSGIGNSHAEPHIPCYNVTRLDRAIVRMISVELSGRYVEADKNEVVRSVGKPDKDGKCQLSSGMLVAAY